MATSEASLLMKATPHSNGKRILSVATSVALVVVCVLAVSYILQVQGVSHDEELAAKKAPPAHNLMAAAKKMKAESYKQVSSELSSVVTSQKEHLIDELKKWNTDKKDAAPAPAPAKPKLLTVPKAHNAVVSDIASQLAAKRDALKKEMMSWNTPKAKKVDSAKLSQKRTAFMQQMKKWNDEDAKDSADSIASEKSKLKASVSSQVKGVKGDTALNKSMDAQRKAFAAQMAKWDKADSSEDVITNPHAKLSVSKKKGGYSSLAQKKAEMHKKEVAQRESFKQLEAKWDKEDKAASSKALKAPAKPKKSKLSAKRLAFLKSMNNWGGKKDAKAHGAKKATAPKAPDHEAKAKAKAVEHVLKVPKAAHKSSLAKEDAKKAAKKDAKKAAKKDAVEKPKEEKAAKPVPIKADLHARHADDGASAVAAQRKKMLAEIKNFHIGGSDKHGSKKAAVANKAAVAKKADGGHKAEKAPKMETAGDILKKEGDPLAAQRAKLAKELAKWKHKGGGIGKELAKKYAGKGKAKAKAAASPKKAKESMKDRRKEFLAEMTRWKKEDLEVNEKGAKKQQLDESSAKAK